MDINSKNPSQQDIIVLWGSQRSLKQWISSYAHADHKSLPVCGGEALPREDSRLFQELPGLSASRAPVGGKTEKVGGKGSAKYPSSVHSFTY